MGSGTHGGHNFRVTAPQSVGCALQAYPILFVFAFVPETLIDSLYGK